MTRTGWLASLVAFVVMVGALIALVASPYSPFAPLAAHTTLTKSTSLGTVVDLHAEIGFWKKRIAMRGGAMAFAELSESVAALPLGIQHVVAHAFGQALYETKGVEGFAGCGAAFGQGCLHQFFGLAIRDHGLGDGLKHIVALCSAQKSPIDVINCEHGVGHGIMGYLGYSTDDLLKAIAICDGVNQGADVELGCRGGAFMEYNFRPLIHADAGVDTRIRQLSSATTYAPCDSVPKGLTVSCIFWQPWWWHVEMVGATDDISLFRTLGAYCEKAPGGEVARTRCYQGIGYMIPNRVQPSLADAARLCAAASDVVGNRLSCWSYAVPLIGPANMAYADALCDGLDKKGDRVCRAHVSDTNDIFSATH